MYIIKYVDFANGYYKSIPEFFFFNLNTLNKFIYASETKFK